MDKEEPCYPVIVQVGDWTMKRGERYVHMDMTKGTVWLISVRKKIRKTASRLMQKMNAEVWQLPKVNIKKEAN